MGTEVQASKMGNHVNPIVSMIHCTQTYYDEKIVGGSIACEIASLVEPRMEDRGMPLPSAYVWQG